MRAADGEFSIAEYVEMEVIWDRLRVTSSRPYGTFRLSNLYPGLRPGLSSAVPAGLRLQLVDSQADSSLEPKPFRPGHAKGAPGLAFETWDPPRKGQ